MNFHLYQLVILLVSAFMIYQGINNYIKGKSGQTFYKLMIRIIVWGGMTTIAIFHGFTNFLAGIIGLEGNINAVILTGFLLIFLMIFKLLSSIERLEQQISEVTRKDAIKEIHNNSNLK
jgi:hypothetical protein